jgi:2-succinyl-6-hydroxy-2,4-cyclohexadiene-1-carboxylate synthase
VARIALIHGFTQTSECWGPLRDALEPDHDVAAIDAPGHGTAGDVSADLPTAGELAFDIGGASTYLGYSMGGRIAMHTALAHPRDVERLVLISATPGIVDDGERAARRRDDDALADHLIDVGVATFVREWLARPMFAGILPGLRFEHERATNTPEGLAMSLRRCGTGTQRPVWDRLSELTMPTLLIAGREDPKFAAIATEMATVIPDATLEIVEGAGHTAHLERPEAVVAAVTNWLG